MKWERDAWFTALEIASFTGKIINHSKLLPEAFADEPERMTKEEKEEEKRKVKKQLGIK